MTETVYFKRFFSGRTLIFNEYDQKPQQVYRKTYMHISIVYFTFSHMNSRRYQCVSITRGQSDSESLTWVLFKVDYIGIYGKQDKPPVGISLTDQICFGNLDALTYSSTCVYLIVV